VYLLTLWPLSAPGAGGVSPDGPKPSAKNVEAGPAMVDKSSTMKSAYELAMERLNKTAPASKLTAAQKKQLAELDSQYAAKIAGREIALNSEIARAAADFEKEESLRDQLVNERKKLQAELEEKKDQVRRCQRG
jgi:hypothetical protein